LNNFFDSVEPIISILYIALSRVITFTKAAIVKNLFELNIDKDLLISYRPFSENRQIEKISQVKKVIYKEIYPPQKRNLYLKLSDNLVFPDLILSFIFEDGKYIDLVMYSSRKFIHKAGNWLQIGDI